MKFNQLVHACRSVFACARTVFGLPAAFSPNSRLHAAKSAGRGERISLAGLPLFVLLVALLVPTVCYAQSEEEEAPANPVPFITEILPVSTQPGIGSKGAGSDLTLTAMGAGFINGTSAIYWNGKALPNPTTCTAANPPVQASCTVVVPGTNIAAAGTANITVVNPSTSPAVGTSSTFYFNISNATSSVTTSRKDIDVGGTSYALSVGDFNGDGKVDLVVANWDSATVTVLRGDGAGNFAATAGPTSLAASPRRMAIGDFNGDGELDVAVTNPRANTVTILLGDGNGGLTVASSPATGNFPSWLAVGDFNGDGLLDLAVTNYSDDTVSILLGNGDGTFTATSPVATGDTPVGVAVGDYNGDGKLDLVVANQFSNNLTILLGNGDGTFTAGASPAAGDWPQSPAVGDFNGDGKLDIAVANPRSNTATILLGDGTGNFTLASSPATGQWPPVLVAADFNADRKLDLAVANQKGFSMTILLGDGTGNFVTASTPAVGAFPVPVAFADFNGDGRLDLATANSGSNSISILMQAPDLTISKTHAVDFTSKPGQVYSITATNGGSAPTTGTVTVTDTLPTGLTATAMDGGGWDCSNNSFPVAGNGTATVSCTRADALAPGASYPAITLTVDVADGAPASVINTATVSGGGESETSNDTATDPTAIVVPAVGFSVASLTFNAQLVGSTSAAQTMTLTNGGTATLNISSVVASGDFSQTNTCGASVAAGANCSISVTFTPTATGTRAGSITVTDDAPGSPHSIPLSGTAIASEVSLSPTSLIFLAQFVGTTGLPQNVTLTNTGSAALTISNVQAGGDFAATSGCTSNLAPGVNCSIGVFFDPSASGSRSGTLTITDDAPGSPHTLALTGTGQDFTITAASSSASISAGETAMYTLSLAPGGGLNQTATLTCKGAPALATCSVPSTMTLNGTSPSTVTVTVSTTASTMAPPGSRPTWPSWPRGVGGLWWLMAPLALGVGRLMQQAYARGGCAVPRSSLTLGMLMLLVVMWAACGGGSANVVHNPGTPTGSYNLTVTVTVTSGSATLNHSTNLGLTIH